MSMAQTRDWHGMKDMSARLLKERTGEGVDAWNRRIKRERLDDEGALRAWLTKQGVTGYAQSLLVMERFGYPDFLLATADELIDGQYADRPKLRPIFDAIIDAASGLGKVTIQARKTYVSLVSARRTFARIQPTKSAGIFPSATKLPSNCLDFVRFCIDSYQKPQSSARRLATCPASIAS